MGSILIVDPSLTRYTPQSYRKEFVEPFALQKKLEDWRKYYNEERPHGAIGNQTPITLLNHDGVASPPW